MNELKFSRMELSGSLADLGTILPLTLGMVLMNDMHPAPIFFCFGAYAVLSGLYFRVTMPVEPMKIISAYAIASGITATEVQASGLLMALLLLLIGGTGFINTMSKMIPLSVIRGVQLATGTLLSLKGIQLLSGTSQIQKAYGIAEPFLSIQHIGPLPIGITLGIILGILTLFLLENDKVPAAVTIFILGYVIGLLLEGTGIPPLVQSSVSPPLLLPYGFPGVEEFSFALLILVVPQIPMTIGNAVIANADLCRQYFPDNSDKVTGKSLCLSMAIANLLSSLLGGIPMCHGAGGLASRYRFGARTAGSNVIIGTIFIILSLFLGHKILTVLHHVPLAVLGVLLIFAGLQLCFTFLTISAKKDIFVIVIMLVITLEHNLAAAFLIGIAVALLLRSKRITI